MGDPARSSALRSASNGLMGARQRAIEFVEEWAGLLRVSFEVVLYAEWSLAPTYFGWIG